MAQLVVRNLDQAIVDALKKRAARHGHSAEAEHRAILSEALLRSEKKSFRPVQLKWAGHYHGNRV